jgi:CrcB protein
MGNSAQLRTWLAISLGAIAGALCRFYIGSGMVQLLGTAFPYGTMLINVSGCFAMGFFTALAARTINIHPDVRLLVTTGFLGSYTTFSSYELDTEKLLQRSLEQALCYWLASACLGWLALQLGTRLAELLPARPDLTQINQSNDTNRESIDELNQ